LAGVGKKAKSEKVKGKSCLLDHVPVAYRRVAGKKNRKQKD